VQHAGIEVCHCNVVVRKMLYFVLQMFLNVTNTRSSNTVREQVLSLENYSKL